MGVHGSSWEIMKSLSRFMITLPPVFPLVAGLFSRMSYKWPHLKKKKGITEVYLKQDCVMWAPSFWWWLAEHEAAHEIPIMEKDACLSGNQTGRFPREKCDVVSSDSLSKLTKGAGCCELFLVIAGKAIRSSHGSGNPIKAFNMTCQNHNCESEFDDSQHQTHDCVN